MARLRAVVVIQAPGLSGHAPLRPCLERADERLLDGLLGQVEIADRADQARDHQPLLLAEQAVDGLARRVRPGQEGVVGLGRQFVAAAVARSASAAEKSQIGRTSIDPCLAPGIIAAYSIASSRSAASTT